MKRRRVQFLKPKSTNTSADLALDGNAYHTSVMLDESLAALELQSGSRVLDCNLGGGGHSQAILDRAGSEISLVGIDCDQQAISYASRRLANYSNFRAVQLNFADLGDANSPDPEIAALNLGKFDAILMDLGVSSAQLDQGERGFSFRFDAPLDMRMDDRLERTAADLLAEETEAELRTIFFEYGEEPHSRAIARTIVEQRKAKPFETTAQLADLVSRFYKKPSNRHPATKVFQALRIAVNDEMGALKAALESLIGWLNPAGRWVILTYHSLEDRMVKRFFQDHLGRCKCPRDFPTCTCNAVATLRLSKHNGLRASPTEIDRNPRARSATLRSSIKI
jgi:16S rRNA (cytosine1402-N4)-methyltransferase